MCWAFSIYNDVITLRKGSGYMCVEEHLLDRGADATCNQSLLGRNYRFPTPYLNR